MVLPLAFVACKKKDKNNPEPTKEEMLKSGKWKISKLNFSNTSGSQDLLGTMADCDKDNFYYFNADNSITKDEGATKCNSGDPQSTTDGKWLLENDNTLLTFKESSIFGSSSTMSVSVVSLSSSNIEFSKDSTVTIPGIGTLSGKFTGTFTNVK